MILLFKDYIECLPNCIRLHCALHLPTPPPVIYNLSANHSVKILICFQEIEVIQLTLMVRVVSNLTFGVTVNASASNQSSRYQDHHRQDNAQND